MDGVAVRPWWIVQSRLDRLRADGLISTAAHDAACRLRDDVHRLGRVPGSPLARIGIQGPPGGGDRHGDMLGRLTATRRLRAIRARLGARCYGIAWAVIVEDLPWAVLARRLGGCDAGTAKRAAARAIARLVGV